MPRLLTFALPLSLLGATLSTPAMAQDGGLPPAPAEAEPVFRIAPETGTDFDETVIELGALDAVTPSVTTVDTRIFAHFDGAATLTRQDRAEIEAEIAQRFGRQAAPARIQTGLVFEPDLSMVLKPLEAAGTLRGSRG